MQRPRSLGLVVLLWLAASGAPACGDSDPRPPGAVDVALADTDVTPDTPAAPDVAPETAAPGDAAGDGAPEAGAAETIDAAPDAPPADVPPTDLPPPPTDTDFPDLVPDRTPPTIVAVEPADGTDNVATNFVVRVRFSEPIRPMTIDDFTFQVTDLTDRKIAGSYALEDNNQVAVFTPAASAVIFNSTPYFVTLATQIEDLAYNNLERIFRFRFYTAPYPNLDGYEALAGRYAPHLMQQTLPMDHSPHLDYLAPVDLDGDWNALNNVQYIRSTARSVLSVVYYAVVESKTHFFIFYLYYHPYREVAEPSQSYGSDLAGAMVLVEKRPVERPLAVYTYFKQGTAEDIHAFVTQESDIVAAPFGSGEKLSQYVRGVYPQQTLFPDGRHTGWLTTSTHQSCLWIDTEDHSPDPSCELRPAQQESMMRVEYRYAPGPGWYIDRQGAEWPSALTDVNYELQSALHKLWVRRAAFGEGELFSELYEYEPYDQPPWAPRPGNTGEIGSKFASPDASPSAFGRPPWAWRWKPSAGSYVDLPRGTLFLDPALFVQLRHNRVPAFDDVTQTGFSLDYCFHPYLNIDLRSVDPDCAP